MKLGKSYYISYLGLIHTVISMVLLYFEITDNLNHTDKGQTKKVKKKANKKDSGGHMKMKGSKKSEKKKKMQKKLITKNAITDGCSSAVKCGQIQM